MSKTWVFIGGMVAGIAGVFAAAFAAEEFDARKQPSKDDTIETEELLALPITYGIFRTLKKWK